MKVFATGLALIFSFSAFSETPKVSLHDRNCGANAFEGVKFKYCIDYGDRANNKDLLYIFSGSSRTENDWIEDKANRAIQKYWDTNQIPSPTKITISLGDEWMITEVATDNLPALQPLIVNKIIPYIEQKFSGEIGHRFLKGESMGGWNGVQLLLKNSELFDRVALVCPVIAPIGPFSAPSTIGSFINRNKPYINKDWVDDLINEEREMFPSKEDWNNHNPLELIKTADIKSAKIYLSCGDRDEYGFFEGTERFAKIAAKRALNITWEPLRGAHCVSNSKSIAKFFNP